MFAIGAVTSKIYLKGKNFAINVHAMAENVVTVIDQCLTDSTLFTAHAAIHAIRNTRN